MKYYKVIKGDRFDYTSGYTTIKNELLTEKERNKKFNSLSSACFEVVEISKKKIYFFFGARFEIQ